MTSTLRGPPI